MNLNEGGMHEMVHTTAVQAKTSQIMDQGLSWKILAGNGFCAVDPSDAKCRQGAM